MRSSTARFSKTLVAVVVLVALLGYLYLQRSTEREEQRQKVFPDISGERIVELVIKYPSFEVFCSKEGDEWVIVKGLKKLEANERLISRIVDDIKGLEVEKVIPEDTSDLSGFGLESPRVEVVFRTPLKEHRILVGDESPVGSGVYIRVDDKRNVFLVDREFSWNFVGRSFNDFRNKTIISLDADSVNGLFFRVGETSIELERKGDRWFVKGMPEHVEVDSSKVLNILRTFSNFEIKEFEDENPENLETYGLDNPRAEVVLHTSDKGKIQILFGNRNENGDYYVKLASDPQVYSVSDFVFDALPKHLSDIRVRRLVNLNVGDVKLLSIKNGDKVVSLVKEGDEWKLKQKNGAVRVDQTKVSQVISSIVGLEVRDFVSDSPEDLSVYGLDSPAVEVTVSSKPEKEGITLLFGKHSEDNGVYVKVAGKEPVYTVEDKALSSITGSLEDISGQR